jgi:hypothetical protein
MRERLWFPCLLATATIGCATQRDTGAALFGAGAATAIVGASAASSTHCTAFGCYYRNPAPWGSKAALVGAALAAAGYAVMATAPRGDVQTHPAGPPPPAPGEAWRLRRKNPAPPPPSEPTEEREP